jgi:hypothetical protein
MEAVGAAASVIAVVSLSIQICGCAREICDFFNSIVDAPKEIKNIQVQVELVHTICEGVKRVVERAQKNETIDADSTYFLACISSALGVAKDKLDNLRTSVLKTEVRAGRSGQRRWDSFKYAVKKPQLAEVERQLSDVVLKLNVAMTTNMM